MAGLLPPTAAETVRPRLRLAVSLIVAALQIIDSEVGPGSAEAQALFDNAVAMAAAAIAAPIP